jgi:hypothetical protein
MVGGSRQIFISYARSDAGRVDELVEGLRQLHYDAWLDQELTGGQPWWDVVLAHIRASSAVLVAVSPAALESIAVRREYEYGDAVGRPLLPVIVGNVLLEVLPSLLAPLQVVDYRQSGAKGAFALADALANLPGPRALPQPLPDPPPVPISYLSGLKDRSQAAALSMDEQLSLITQLKAALGRASEQAAAEEVLRSLQRRHDLYQVSAREIESLLSPLDRQVPAPKAQEAPSTQSRAARLLADAAAEEERAQESQPRVTRIRAPRVDVPALAEVLRLWYENQNLEAIVAVTPNACAVQCRKRRSSKPVSEKNALLTVLLHSEDEDLVVEFGSANWVGKAVAAGVAGVVLVVPALAITGIAAAGAWQRRKLMTETVSFLRNTAPNTSAAHGD